MRAALLGVVLLSFLSAPAQAVTLTFVDALDPNPMTIDESSLGCSPAGGGLYCTGGGVSNGNVFLQSWDFVVGPGARLIGSFQASRQDGANAAPLIQVHTSGSVLTAPVTVTADVTLSAIDGSGDGNAVVTTVSLDGFRATLDGGELASLICCSTDSSLSESVGPVLVGVGGSSLIVTMRGALIESSSSVGDAWRYDVSFLAVPEPSALLAAGLAALAAGRRLQRRH